MLEDRKYMLEHRPHAPTGTDEEGSISDKFFLKDNNFDSESDGECPPLAGKASYESESSSDDSDIEDDYKHNPKCNIDDLDNEDNYSYSNIKMLVLNLCILGINCMFHQNLH